MPILSRTIHSFTGCLFIVIIVDHFQTSNSYSQNCRHVFSLMGMRRGILFVRFHKEAAAGSPTLINTLAHGSPSIASTCPFNAPTHPSIHPKHPLPLLQQSLHTPLLPDPSPIVGRKKPLECLVLPRHQHCHPPYCSCFCHWTWSRALRWRWKVSGKEFFWGIRRRATQVTISQNPGLAPWLVCYMQIFIRGSVQIYP